MMSREQLHDQMMDLTKGAASASTSILAVIVSLQDKIETVLRFTSLIVGIACGLVTIWSMIRRSKR